MDKLKALEERGQQGTCTACGAVQVYGIRSYDKVALTAVFECEKCILAEAREARGVLEAKAERRQRILATGKGGGNRDKAEKDRYMEQEEWEKFIRCVDKKIYFILWQLLYCTGARLGEALLLRREAFKAESSEIVITSLKRKDKYQGTYLLPAFLVTRLIELNRRRGEPIFINADFRIITHRMAQHQFKRATKAAGLSARLSPHCLRHLFGVRVWQETGDLVATAKMMRHQQMSNTERYMHLNDKDKKEILEKLMAQKKEKKDER